MKHLTTIALSLTLGALTLSGCGGGGGSTVATRAKATVLVTDSFREDFGHVWATIYQVELVAQDGSTVVVFDDPSGRQIDLKTLRDSSGSRYSFLSTTSVPEATYTGARVTVGPTMQLFRAGVAVGDPIPVDSSIPVNGSGQPVLDVTFRSPKTLSASETATNICIDFDLARFVLRNSRILPALIEGDGLGLGNPERHEHDDYHGVVSGLTGTAPDLTFTLNRGRGMSVTVTTSAATALYGNPLSNNSVVEVTGTLDTTTNALVATRVEVRGVTAPREETGQDNPRAAGAATNLDAAAGTFSLTLQRVHDFTPSQTTVTVATNNATVYRADGGTAQTQAQFFAALAATPRAVVSGTYDAATNTLTASSVGVVDKSKDGGWVRGHGNFRDERGVIGWGNDAVDHGHHSGKK